MAEDFDKIEQDNCILYIRRASRNESFEQALMGGEERLRQIYTLSKVRSSKFSRVYKLNVDFDGVETRLYYKWYLHRSAWDFIKHICRPSRAKRAFSAKLMLAENNFDAPNVVAVGEYRRGLLHKASFLVTRAIENVKSTYELLFEDVDSRVAEQLRAKRRQIEAFGQTIGKMHENGIFHGDLRLANTLAKKGSGGWRFFFLDNERTRRFRRLPRRQRVKNLVQVNLFPPGQMSSTDRMRFFKAYAAENKMTRGSQKKLMRETLEKTARRLGKKEAAVETAHFLFRTVSEIAGRFQRKA